MPAVNPGEIGSVDFGLAAKVRPALLLTGQTKDRQEVVNAFQNDPGPAVFLLSLARRRDGPEPHDRQLRGVVRPLVESGGRGAGH